MSHKMEPFSFQEIKKGGGGGRRKKKKREIHLILKDVCYFTVAFFK